MFWLEEWGLSSAADRAYTHSLYTCTYKCVWMFGSVSAAELVTQAKTFFLRINIIVLLWTSSNPHNGSSYIIYYFRLASSCK